MPENYWDDDYEELTAIFPLRVHRWGGRWVCSCLTYDQTGKCRHLVPFLPKENVEVKEEYL